tara:strand:+ start:341 stop:5602 length:5262 start_codon:yes stop_codon:yes gene_type:complete
MAEPHPYLSLSLEEQSAAIRLAFGLEENEEIPPHLLDMAQSTARIPKSDETIDLEMGHLSKSLEARGIPQSENWIHAAQRDRDLDAFGTSLEESLPPQQGFLGDVQDQWSNAATQLKRASANAQHTIFKGIQLMDWGLEEFYGLGTGLEGFFDDKSLRGIKDKDEWYQGQIARRESEMVGSVGWLRSSGRVVNSVAAGITPFVAAGAISTVTTGTPMAGVLALTAGYANTIGHDVYEQTGSVEQGVVAAWLNFAATTASFKAGHIFGKQMNYGLKTILKHRMPETLAQLGTKLKWGDTAGFMNILKGAVKIEGSVMFLREVEYGLNATYQEFFEEDNRAEQYEFSVDNALSVLGHAAQEGALFIAMPMLGTGGMLGVAGRGSRAFSAARAKNTSSLQSLAKKLESVSGSERAKLLENLANGVSGTRESNPLIRMWRNILEGKRDGKTEKEINEGMEKDQENWNKMKEKDQTRNHEEFAEWIDEVIPKDTASAKPSAKTVESGEEGTVGERVRPRVIEAEERISSMEVEVEGKIQRRTEADTKLTVEEAEKIHGKKLEVDAVEAAWEAVNDSTGESVLALREKIATLEKTKGGRSTEQGRQLEGYKEALRTAEILMDTVRGTTPTGGPKASPRITKVGEKEYDNDSAATVLGRNKRSSKEKLAERDALAEQIIKDKPEWAGKTPGQLAKLVKAERIPSRTDIASKNTLTPDERKEGLRVREEALATRVLETTKTKALSVIKRAAKSAKQLQRKMRLDDKAGATALRKVWNDYISNVLVDLKEAGVDKKIIAKVKKIQDKAKSYKSKEITGDKSKLEAKIQEVYDVVQALLMKSAEKRTKEALKRNKGDRGSTGDKMLEAIGAESTTAEKVSALYEYTESVKNEVTSKKLKEEAEYEREVVEAILSKEGKLTLEETSYLGRWAEGLHDKHTSRRAVELAREQARVELGAEALNREILEMLGFENAEQGFERKDGGSSTAEGMKDFVKAVGWGMATNGRLADSVEYLTGGTNTTGFRYLVRDVIKSHALSRQAEGKLQKGLRDYYKSSKWKVTDKDLKEVSESQAKNHHTNKKFAPAQTITLADGTKVHLSTGEVVGIIAQSRDGSTVNLWSEGAGLRLKGRGQAINAENSGKNMGELVAEIVKTEKDKNSAAYRVANALVDFINTESPTEMVRQAGFRIKGVDMIEARELGDSFFPRTRRLKEDTAELKEEKYTDLYDMMESSLGLDTSGPKISKGAVAKRTNTEAHDIVVGDAQFTINSWFRAVSNLRHFDESITRAQKILGHAATEKTLTRLSGEKKGSGRLARKLIGQINEGFYEPQLKVERGVTQNRNEIDGWIRTVRNNLVTAGLAFNPAIPVYQALSLIAASGHMGTGGKRAILQALYEVSTGGKEYWSNLKEQGTSVSGLLYERLTVGNASALASGETNQSLQGNVVLGGKRVKSTVKGGLSGTYERTVNAGMRPIEFVDNYAVLALFRATEIQLQRRWEAKGKSREGNEEVFNEWLREEFEANLIETQPSYAPLHQPRIVNMAKENTYISFYTMYKGYTAKLVAMQRRAFMRASRAKQEGNLRGWFHHMSYGAKMAIYGSALIPLIRTGVKESISQGGAEVSEMFGITEEQDRELGDFALTVLEKSSLQLSGQLVGITPLGDIMDSLVKTSFGVDEYGQGVSGAQTPYMQTVVQMWKGVSSMVGTDADVSAEDWVRRVMSVVKPASGIAFKTPQSLYNIPNSVWREIQGHRDELIEERKSIMMGTGR